MIVHASQKMDISFYMEWLHTRLQEEFFDKDINEKTIHRILLKDISELVLYCKNPTKIYRNRDLFEKYNPKLITSYTAYDLLYEPKVKDKEKILKAINKCHKAFRNYVLYGPIFLTEIHSLEWHKNQFKWLCEQTPETDGYYISFDINQGCQKSKRFGCVPLDATARSIILDDLRNVADDFNRKVEMLPSEETFDIDEIDVGLNNCCPNACEYCKYITAKSAAINKYKTFNQRSTMLYGIKSAKQNIVEIDLNKQKDNSNQSEPMSLLEMLAME